MSIDRRKLVVLGAAGAAATLHSSLLRTAAAVQRGSSAAGDELPAREASWYKKLEEGRVECV